MEEVLKHILSEIKDIRLDMTDLKQDVSGLKEDVIHLKDSQGRVEAKDDNLLSELRSNFKFTHEKLDEHHKVFNVVSDEMKGMKVDIEYLSSKTGRHDTELNKIMKELRG